MPARRTDPNDRLGLLLVGFSSLGMGLAIAISRFAFEGGANGLTVATARSWLFVPALYLFCRMTGRDVFLGRRDWLHLLGLGLLMSMAFYGNIGSVQFIPVGLSAILFFTFPPLIAVFEAVLSRKAPGLAKSLALAVAFVGLALMLGVSFGEADLRGMLLALGAAIAVAWNSVWIARRLSHVDSVVATLHMGVVATTVLTTIAVLSDGLAFPQVRSGWIGLVLVACFQTLCLPLFYMSMSRIGVVKAGMISNVQPLVSIVAAFALFGEVLRATQLLGGAMVLAGIWLMQARDRAEH